MANIYQGQAPLSKVKAKGKNFGLRAKDKVKTAEPYITDCDWNSTF